MSRYGVCIWSMLVWAAALPAYGQQDLGGVADNVKGQIGNVADMLGAVAFLIGIILVIMSLMKFKAHSENDPQAKMSTAVVMLMVGASMIALPTLAGVGITSIFGGGGTNVKADATLRSIP